MQNSYELYIFHFLLLALKRIHLFDILLDGVFCLKTGGPERGIYDNSY